MEAALKTRLIEIEKPLMKQLGRHTESFLAVKAAQMNVSSASPQWGTQHAEDGNKTSAINALCFASFF